MTHASFSCSRALALITLVGTRMQRRWALRGLVGLALALGAVDSKADDDGQPTIMKDWVQVTPFTLDVFHKSNDTWSWVPTLRFRVNGPIASGSQLYATFSIPGSGPWVKFDCKTSDTPKGRWWKTDCGGRSIGEDNGSTYTGPVDFAIKMRNELAKTDVTLFTGKAKVAKVHSNEHGPAAANKFVYFVDQDWNMPIGYLFLTPDDVQGMKLPRFNAAFWTRGDASNFQAHLFYKGNEVGKLHSGSDEVGKPSCDVEVDDTTTHIVDDSVPQKARWSRVVCTFFNVKAWDQTGQKPGMFGPPHLLAGNPGDYEFKLLWQNNLARSIKFTVGADGKFDNGIATANSLGDNRVIVPVQILGDQDGQWDHTAWRNDAFYGNSLSGFQAP
jgi:hypothetical protein